MAIGETARLYINYQQLLQLFHASHIRIEALYCAVHKHFLVRIYPYARKFLHISNNRGH